MTPESEDYPQLNIIPEWDGIPAIEMEDEDVDYLDPNYLSDYEGDIPVGGSTTEDKDDDDYDPIYWDEIGGLPAYDSEFHPFYDVEDY